MANKRITQLTAVTTLNSTDVFHVGQTAADKKITKTNLASQILGGAVIGGTAAGSITTNGGTQQITNKQIQNSTILNTDISLCDIASCDITNCTINGGDALTVDSDDINTVCATTATTAQLNNLVGTTGPIQTQIVACVNRFSVSQFYPLCAYVNATSNGDGQIVISDSTIRAFIGLGSTIKIVPSSVQVQVYMDHGTSRDKALTAEVRLTLSSGYVSSIAIKSLTASTDYSVSITFLITQYA